jgi:DNA polymerase-4
MQTRDRTRKILHLDLDAFFCAVEEQRDPALIGKPFAVGGRPEERGVVSSCSYPARAFGVRSAMPMGRARQLCPQLQIVPPHYDLYHQLSQQVMERLRAVTPLVEQVSIDEAFLDVSDRPESGEALARRLQAQIRAELGLPCSLGIAANKLVAKIANDYGKRQAPRGAPPNAITVVPPGEEARFLAPLPAEALWGVGPKTAARLAKMGIRTIGDIARWPEEELVERFGKNGREMARHARGIDDQPVITSHEAKSISQEVTFARDTRDLETLQKTLHSLSQGVGRSLREAGLCCWTVKLKFRWPDFKTATRQLTLPNPTDDDEVIFSTALKLFHTLWKPKQAVRLLGVGASKLLPASQAGSATRPEAKQLSLW